MSSYKYGDTITMGAKCNTFERYLNYMYEAMAYKVPLYKDIRPLSNQKSYEGKDGIAYYTGIYENIYFGDKVYLGPQWMHYSEKYGDNRRTEYPYGIYEFVGLAKEKGYADDKDWGYQFFVLKHERFGEIEVRTGAVMLTGNAIIFGQKMHGFFVPNEVRELWPETGALKENKIRQDPYKEEPEKEYPISNGRLLFDAVVGWGGLSLMATVICLGYLWKIFADSVDVPYSVSIAGYIGAGLIPTIATVLFIMWDMFVVFLIARAFKFVSKNKGGKKS